MKTIKDYFLCEINLFVGAVHEPTFKYRVTVGELVATGEGQSKKKAKHTAAKSMLDKLIAVNQTSTAPPKAAKVVELPKDLDAELLSPHDDGINGNPVGKFLVRKQSGTFLILVSPHKAYKKLDH